MMPNDSLRLLLLVTVSGINLFGQQARVRVLVSDAYGGPLSGGHITMAGGDSVIDISQASEVTLNYGHYTLKIEMPAFEVALRPVTIDQPQQILTVAMKIGRMDNEINPCSIIGRVSPTESLIRMRLVQLFGSYLADVPSTADGSFQFRNLTCGEYMVIAMSAKGCMGIKMATARVLAERFEMKIDATKGAYCQPAKE